MSDQKIKAAAGKPPLAMIPLRALKGVARVFGYGAKKYAPGNFLTAQLEDGAGERYPSALLRHLSDIQEPNGLFTTESLSALDPESALPHIDHAICGLIMLRAILTKEGALPEDPGVGNDPPNAVPKLAAACHACTGGLGKRYWSSVPMAIGSVDLCDPCHERWLAVGGGPGTEV